MDEGIWGIPIYATHDLLRIKVDAAVVGILKSQGELCETATAQFTLIPFADHHQASASNSFLPKRLLTKTHSDQTSSLFERTAAIFITITQNH